MLDHLSYSPISSYLLCHRYWKFHYIDQIPALKSTSLLFGGAIHAAIETHILSGFAGSANVGILKQWEIAWKNKLQEGGGIDWGNETPEFLFNEGIRTLTEPDVLKLINALRPLNAESIEREVTLRVPGVPIPIIGYIDMIEADGIPCDFKTSSKSWSQERAYNELQPVFYLAALNQMGYQLEGMAYNWYFRHYVFVRNKTPRVEIWETERTPTQMLWLFELIRECWQAIQSGIFAPTGVGSFECSPKYCEYWGICRGKR